MLILINFIEDHYGFFLSELLKFPSEFGLLESICSFEIGWEIDQQICQQ